MLIRLPPLHDCRVSGMPQHVARLRAEFDSGRFLSFFALALLNPIYLANATAPDLFWIFLFSPILYSFAFSSLAIKLVLTSGSVLGADYDMTKCTLGDLDPHAVASVFKAYLRERVYRFFFST